MLPIPGYSSSISSNIDSRLGLRSCFALGSSFGSDCFFSAFFSAAPVGAAGGAATVRRLARLVRDLPRFSSDESDPLGNRQQIAAVPVDGSLLGPQLEPILPAGGDGLEDEPVDGPRGEVRLDFRPLLVHRADERAGNHRRGPGGRFRRRTLLVHRRVHLLDERIDVLAGDLRDALVILGRQKDARVAGLRRRREANDEPGVSRRHVPAGRRRHLDPRVVQRGQVVAKLGQALGRPIRGRGPVRAAATQQQ